jgi:two-component sensor histidine kinase
MKMATAAERFAKLSTPAKLLLILTAALLPIGFALVWIAYDGIHTANATLRNQSTDQARSAAQSVESLIARNVLALRIAANGRLADGPTACQEVQKSLAIAPAVAQQFRLDSGDSILCVVGDLGDTGPIPTIAPGDIHLAVTPDDDSLLVQVGVTGGSAMTVLSSEDLRKAALDSGSSFDGIRIEDGVREIDIMASDQPLHSSERRLISRWPVGNRRLLIEVDGRVPAITTVDVLIIILPVVMWFVAALISWLVVTRLLIQPLRRLERSVRAYAPGGPPFELPRRLGLATEIREFRDAFARSVAKVQESEQEMSAALEGQRKLVREVHHRVKNNLQVVASLLNIHGRSAETPAARSAYGAIGRRVGALAIVHRNHFAEMEENRGISLRPLLSELSAELRAGAPESARGLVIDLELESVNTTQDMAVPVAFLITEVVEFAMLRRPDQPVEVILQRSSDLTARLTLGSPVLVPEEDDDRERMQFERIIAGLARQLRSSLERKLGRYSVELPVFPGT